MERDQAKELILEEISYLLSTESLTHTDILKFWLNNEDIAGIYPQDWVHETADSNVDVYTSNLLEWVARGYTYVEDAISEFGFPEHKGQPDFMKAIMQGQYLENQRFLTEEMDEVKSEIEWLIDENNEVPDYDDEEQVKKAIEMLLESK